MSVCKPNVLYVVTVIGVQRSYWGRAEKHGVDSLWTLYALVHVFIVQSMQDLYWQRQGHTGEHSSLGTPVFSFPSPTILPCFSPFMPNFQTTGFWHRTVQSTMMMPHSKMERTFPICYKKMAKYRDVRFVGSAKPIFMSVTETYTSISDHRPRDRTRQWHFKRQWTNEKTRWWILVDVRDSHSIQHKDNAAAGY